MQDITIVEFKVGERGSVLDDLTEEFVSKCKIVHIDIGHTGKDEKDILDKLYSKRFSGIILLDDIHLQQGQQTRGATLGMEELWNSLEYDKYDVSKYAHWSGTGLVLMNCDAELIFS